jgi:hypothetical protein
MTERDAKQAFALALMERPGKPFDVAFALWPGNDETSKALFAATNWPTDEEVLDFQRAIVANPEVAGILPSKYQAAREVLDRARKCRDDETYTKLMRLYCEVMGQIDKPNSGIQVNTVTVNKVLVVPAMPTNRADWQRDAIAQQETLFIEGEHAVSVN